MAKIWCQGDRRGEFPVYHTSLYNYFMGSDGKVLATGQMVEKMKQKTNQNAMHTAELIYNHTAGALKQDVVEGTNGTVYPGAEVIKSKNGKPVGEIYQDAHGWGCFHYDADNGADSIGSREEAIEWLKDLHDEYRQDRSLREQGVTEDHPDDSIYLVTKSGDVLGTIYGTIEDAKETAQIYANRHKRTVYAVNPNTRERMCAAEPQRGVAEDLDSHDGLKMKFTKDSDGVAIKAMSGDTGKELGNAELFFDEQGRLDPQTLWVDERYHSQGIAKAMYDFLKNKGYTVIRSWDQTDAGKGFWDKHKGSEVNVWEQGVAEGMFDIFKKKQPEPEMTYPGEYPRSRADIAQWMTDTVEYYKVKHPESLFKLFCPSYKDYLPVRVRVGTSEQIMAQHMGTYKQLRDANPEAKKLARQRYTEYEKYPSGPSDDYTNRVEEHIVKVGSEYELKSTKTGKNLGKYPTRAGAEKREQQVNYFKHKKSQ
jgi:hypothetical protein